MARPAKPVPMCCVTIGYQQFILPFATGMKLVRIDAERIHHAATFRRQIASVRCWRSAKREFVAVKPNQIANQIVIPSDAPRLERF